MGPCKSADAYVAYYDSALQITADMQLLAADFFLGQEMPRRPGMPRTALSSRRSQRKCLLFLNFTS